MDYESRPNSVLWPPLLFVGAAVLALLLHLSSPVNFPGGTAGAVLQVAGVALIAGAILIDVLAVLAFRRHHTTILPNKGADRLITTGIFAWSRNPIYLGNFMLVAGAGLLSGIWALVLAAPVALLATKKLAVEREEQHLSLKFGNDWKTYRQRTRRWFGQKS